MNSRIKGIEKALRSTSLILKSRYWHASQMIHAYYKYYLQYEQQCCIRYIVCTYDMNRQTFTFTKIGEDSNNFSLENIKVIWNQVLY